MNESVNVEQWWNDAGRGKLNVLLLPATLNRHKRAVQ
jgi:hypothetical protein